MNNGLNAQSDPTVQPVPASVVEAGDAADVTQSNPKMALIALGAKHGKRLDTHPGAHDQSLIHKRSSPRKIYFIKT
ncbi:hypothetical protein ACFVZQ_18120, partial [Streptomyces sp. NPDC059538]